MEAGFGLDFEFSRRRGRGPALGLLFASAAPVLDPRITFSRAGHAMVYDHTGRLTYAPNNLLLHSDDLTQSPWLAVASTFAGDTLTLASSGASVLRQDQPFEAGAKGIFSVEMRLPPGSTAAAVWLSTNDTQSWNTGVGTRCVLTSAWVRYYVVGVLTTGPSLRANICNIDQTGVIDTTIPGGDIEVRNPQVERVTYETAPRAYNATTSAAYYGPRFDHDPAKLTVEGPNLINSGDGSSTTGWTATNGTITAVGGRLRVTANGTNYGHATQVVSTEVGRTYRFRGAGYGGNDSAYFVVGSTDSGGQYVDIAGNASRDITFTATSATTYIQLFVTTPNIAGNYAEFDDISLVVLSAEPLGLLIEEARTNLLLYSNDLSNAAWTSNGVATTTGGAAIAPDGTMSATLISFSGASAWRSQDIASGTGLFAASAGGIFVKKPATGGASYTRFTTNDAQAWNTGYSVKVLLTDQWQRVVMPQVMNGAGNPANLRFHIGVVTETSVSDPDCYGDVLVWGGDVQPGAFLTSHIPTTSAAVTRSGDVVSMTDTTWFDRTVGTFVIGFDSQGAGGSRVFAFDTGYAALWLASGTGPGVYDANGIFNHTSRSTKDGIKYALAYDATDISISTDGDAPTLRGGGINWPIVASFFFGSTGGVTEFLNGHIKSLTYYKKRKTNAQLQALTAPTPFGPELIVSPTDLSFNDGSGHNWSYGGGAPSGTKATFNGSDNASSGLYQFIGGLLGFYQVVVVVDSISAGSLAVTLGHNPSGPDYTITTAGTYVFNVNADAGNDGYFRIYGNGTVAVVSAAHVRQAAI